MKNKICLSPDTSSTHPLATKFPIGSMVLVNAEPSIFATYLLREGICDTRVEAVGLAHIVTSEPSKVLNICDLKEKDGETTPYLNVLTSVGLLYSFAAKDLKSV